MIFHIATHGQWAEGVVKGLYTTPSLMKEGFIHCSKPEQIICAANEHYFGRTGLLLLCIRVSALTSPLRYENSYAKGEQFPHIYGPLNLEAVYRVDDFPPGEDGPFVLPENLARFLKADVT